MIKSIYLVLLILTFSEQAAAQDRDYKSYRDSITQLSCGPADSLSVAQTIQRLSTLDTTQFNKNLNHYYIDLGWAYYRLYMHNKDTSFVRLSLNNYLHQPEEERSLWNMAFSYFLLNDCKNGQAYKQLYLKYTRPEDREACDIR